MEGSNSATNNQDWDWEVLVHHSDEHHRHLNPNPKSLPNSEELELQEEEETSFPQDDVIRSDYFSIEYDYSRLHNQDPNSEVEMETAIKSRQDSNCDDPQFGSGSWMDPSQFARTGRVGKRRRNYSSSDSSESSDSSGGSSGDGSGSGSDPRNHLLILQPHCDCNQHSSSLIHFHNHNYKEGFSGHAPEPFDSLSNCQLGSAPPPPQLLLGDDDGHGSATGTGIETGFEIGSPSYSLSGQYDPEYHKGTQAKKEEELEPPHGAAINSPSSDIGGNKDQDVVANMLVQGAEQKEKGIKSSAENEKRRVAWWRVPLEVLKYCVLRVSPVWSLSIAAAALMGLVFFRRRWLSKMKRKSPGLHLNITVDDKKVSQFMSRAARLNEAFSMVKRVPIIRPSLPTPGLAPWPVMSLR